MIKRIFLDMDGVMADWMGGAARLAGKTWTDIKAVWPPNQGFTVHDALGMTEDELSDATDKAGKDFWLGLEEYSWARRLYHTCDKIAPTCILTTPPRAFMSSPWKIVWLRQKFGDDFRNFLLGSQKHFCAAPGHVLIDDSEKNCKDFEKWGGKAILFPQYWNSRHEQWPNAVDIVIKELNGLHHST